MTDNPGTMETQAPPAGGEGQAQEQPAPGAEAEKDAPQWAPPDYLPEHMRGATPEEALEKVWKGYQGYQTAHKSMGQVPESADGYKVELPDDLKAKGLDFAPDDPAMKLLREVAHEARLGDQQFAAIAPAFLEKAVGAGLLEPPINIEKEVVALGEEAGAATPEEAALAGKKRVAQVADFVNGLKARKVLDDAGAKTLLELAVDASGVRVLEGLQKAMSAAETAIPGAPPGAPAGGGVTLEDIQKARADERYNTQSPKHDPAFRKEWDEKAMAFFAQQKKQG